MVIIGAGPVAVELAVALKSRGLKVTIIARSRIMRRLFDPDFSEIIRRIMIRNEVEVLVGQKILEIKGNPVSQVITDQFNIDCDMVIVATGVRPNTDFLKGSGIQLGKNGGIKVNKTIQSSLPDIFAAGDCTEVPDYITGQRRQNAIWPEAVEQGRIAALNIQGEYTEYQGAIQRNVVNIFDVPVLSIGHLEGKRETLLTSGVWRRYTKIEGRIVGTQIIGEIKTCGFMTSVIKKSTHPQWLSDKVFNKYF